MKLENGAWSRATVVTARSNYSRLCYAVTFVKHSVTTSYIRLALTVTAKGCTLALPGNGRTCKGGAFSGYGDALSDADTPP